MSDNSPAGIAWDLPADADPARDNSGMLPDLILFTLVALPMTVPVLRLPLPEVAGIGVIGLAWLRRPTTPTPRPRWFPWLLALLWLVLAASSFLNGVDATRRLGHLAIYAGLALTLSSGRIHRLGATRGLGLGLAIAVVSGLVNWVVPVFGTGYTGRLTGLFHDPNVAGFELTVLGAVALTGARHGPRRWWGVLALVGSVVLTYSRTSLVAMFLGGVWLSVRRVGRTWMALALSGVAAFGVSSIPADLWLWGPFSGREGSDELRSRILAHEQAKLALHPWIGNGGGTSRVTLGPEQTFFFHSSYLGLRNEVGWIGLAVFVALFGLVFWRLVTVPHHLRHPWHEASLIMVAIVGLSLGEVFLELPTAIVLGLAMRHALAPTELATSDGTASPDHVF